MNEESPRKSLVKGERFVRHDDTSEVSQDVCCCIGITAHSSTALPEIATLTNDLITCVHCTRHVSHNETESYWIIEVREREAYARGSSAGPRAYMSTSAASSV